MDKICPARSVGQILLERTYKDHRIAKKYEKFETIQKQYNKLAKSIQR